MNDSKKNSNNRLVLIVIILVLVVMILSASYAYFILLVSKEEDSTQLYTGTLEVKYKQNNIIYEDSLYPRNEPTSLDDDHWAYVNSFTITNTGTLDGYMTIKLDVSENEFPDDALKYKIYNGNGDVFMSGSISSLDSYKLAENLFVRSGESASYSIQIWLEETGIQQNRSSGKKFVAAIDVFEKQIIE